MLHREDLAVLDKETVDLAKRGVSDWSDFAEVTVAGDDLAPAAPSSVTATQVAEGIKLEWTNPTTNADGTTCNDLRWIKIYYKSTTGVSKTNNDGSYVLSGHIGDDQSFTDRIPAQTTRYYVLTALDRSGNESSESSEVTTSAGDIAITSDIPDDATGLIFDDSEGVGGIVIGDGILGIVFQVPSWKAFDHYRLWFQYTDDNGTTWYDKNGNAGAWSEIKSVSRFGYLHKGLNKTWAYHYKATVVATDGTESSIADTAGSPVMKPDASNNDDIVGVLIFAENIVATNEVRGEHIYAGSDIEIASGGKIHSGQTAYNTGTGWWLGDVGGSPKFSIGDGGSSNYLTWDSATGVLTVRGNIIVDSLSFDKITAGTNTASLEIGSGGYIQSSNYSSGSDGFRINGSGNAEFNDVTVRGEIHTSSNSVINGTYVDSLSADKITTGTLTGRKIQTSSSGTRLVMNDAGFADMLVGYDSSGTQQLLISATGGIQATYISNNGGSTTCTLGEGVIGRFSISNSTIFGPASAPTSATDLDLSSYVGARNALVLIRIYNDGSSDTNYRFTTNGDAAWSGVYVDSYPSAFAARVDTTLRYGYVWCMTGSGGHLLWLADIDSSTTLKLIAYIS